MSKERLESLFEKKDPVTQLDENLPPVRKGCGCRTWFPHLEVCPICEKRTIKGILNNVKLGKMQLA